MDNLEKVATLFNDALCRDQQLLEPDGYLNLCAINTYLFALPVVACALWGVVGAALREDGRPIRSIPGNVKMVLTGIYVVAALHLGPSVFNVISVSASTFTLMIIFVLSYMDLNGRKVPVKALEFYFWSISVALGYMFVKLLVSNIDPSQPRTKAALILCTLASLNGAARNIIEAIEPPPTEGQ